jgi:hypothetical protein
MRGGPLVQARVDLADEEKVIPWAQGTDLWGTISGLISGLSELDVITFFVQNPYTCDSVESLAARIGRRPRDIAPVLDGLVREGLLNAVDLPGVRVYELTDDAKQRQTLQQYVCWLQEGYHWARMVLDR